MKEARLLHLAENPPFPNAALPVIVYPAVFPDGRAGFDSLFAANGWTGVWVDGVYSFHHFHAEAHEALGCLRGWADLMLGGPNGTEVRVSAGDALLLPAGTGHRLLRSSPDFFIAGAYPKGQRPDLRRGGMADYGLLKARARAVPLPDTDPVEGAGGAVQAHWRASQDEPGGMSGKAKGQNI